MPMDNLFMVIQVVAFLCLMITGRCFAMGQLKKAAFWCVAAVTLVTVRYFIIPEFFYGQNQTEALAAIASEEWKEWSENTLFRLYGLAMFAIAAVVAVIVFKNREVLPNRQNRGLNQSIGSETEIRTINESNLPQIENIPAVQSADSASPPPPGDREAQGAEPAEIHRKVVLD